MNALDLRLALADNRTPFAPVYIDVDGELIEIDRAAAGGNGIYGFVLHPAQTLREKPAAGSLDAAQALVVEITEAIERDDADDEVSPLTWYALADKCRDVLNGIIRGSGL